MITDHVLSFLRGFEICAVFRLQLRGLWTRSQSGILCTATTNTITFFLILLFIVAFRAYLQIIVIYCYTYVLL